MSVVREVECDCPALRRVLSSTQAVAVFFMVRGYFADDPSKGDVLLAELETICRMSIAEPATRGKAKVWNYLHERGLVRVQARRTDEERNAAFRSRWRGQDEPER